MEAAKRASSSFNRGGIVFASCSCPAAQTQDSRLGHLRLHVRTNGLCPLVPPMARQSLPLYCHTCGLGRIQRCTRIVSNFWTPLSSPAALGCLDHERDVAVSRNCSSKFCAHGPFLCLGSGLTLGFIANTYGLGLRCFAAPLLCMRQSVLQLRPRPAGPYGSALP
eukprot:3742155-Amphidinium_carterae.1